MASCWQVGRSSKHVSNDCFFNTFGSLGLPTSRQNSIKNLPRPIKIHVKIWSASLSNVSWILEANLAPRSSPNPPKIDEKSMKDGHPNQSKFCMYFEWPFGGSWGQHGRKSLPKGILEGAKVLLLLGLDLGRSWGLLGPKS